MPTFDLAGSSVHYHVSGTGSPVILLHSSSSHGGQWKALMEKLQGRHRLYAPDLFGYGRSAALPRDGQPCFVHDLAIVAALLDRCDEPAHLIGHSLGGTLAARAVLGWPDRVCSLTLIEPVLFNLIEETGDPRVADYLALAHAMLVLNHFQEYEKSARLFLDYWIGPQALDEMDSARRSYVIDTVGRVGDDWLGISQHAPGQCRVRDFTGITIPTRLLCGERTRSAARAVVEVLLKTIPGVEYREVPGAGHLSPITHPEIVNQLITDFLTDRDC